MWGFNILISINISLVNSDLEVKSYHRSTVPPTAILPFSLMLRPDFLRHILIKKENLPDRRFSFWVREACPPVLPIQSLRFGSSFFAEHELSCQINADFVRQWPECPVCLLQLFPDRD